MRLGVVGVVGLIVAPALCLGDDVLPYDPSAGGLPEPPACARAVARLCLAPVE